MRTGPTRASVLIGNMAGPYDSVPDYLDFMLLDAFLTK